MRHTLWLFIFVLAACSQAPAPTGLDSLHKRQSLSTPEFDTAWDLTRHRSGVYLVGVTYGNLSNTQIGRGDALIQKYDSTGTVLWSDQFGTTAFDTLYDVASDAKDNAYVAGITFGQLGGASAGSYDSFLRKYSASGRALWTRQFGTALGDSINGIAVRGRHVYVVGESYNLETDESTGFVKKFNHSGRPLWTIPLDTNLYDQPLGIALDHYGNLYIVSQTIVEEGFVSLLLKYTPTGSLIRETRLDLGEFGLVRGVTAHGRSIFVAGDFSDGGYTDIRIIRLNPAGKVVWSRDYGDEGVSESFPDIDTDGQSVVFGGSRVDFEPRDDNGFVSKIDLNGNLIWSKVLGTPDFDTTTATLSTAYGVFAAGYTGGSLGGSYQGKTDAYLARLRSRTGETVWIEQ